MQSSLIYGYRQLYLLHAAGVTESGVDPRVQIVPVRTLFLIRLVVLEKRSCENAIK